MDDFSSSSMIRLIQKGLDLQGISLPTDTSDTSAHIPLSTKRSLTERIFKDYGATVILNIGMAVRHFGEEPLLVALLLARDPLDLIERWRRLEKFSHSRHRTRILDQRDGFVAIEHFAKNPNPSPRASEDLLVMGLLVALAEMIGTEGLKAGFGTANHLCYEEKIWEEKTWKKPGEKLSSSQLFLAWDPKDRQTHPVATPPPSAQLSSRALENIKADLGRSWTVSKLASDMNMSQRSLQRSLRLENTGFSKLLITARVAWSSTRLVQTEHSMSEIGFGAGFSDQPHFTREFHKRVGITPSQYRARFKETPIKKFN